MGDSERVHAQMKGDEQHACGKERGWKEGQAYW